MKPNAIYDVVKGMALPLVEAYHNDVLVHDLNAITGNPGTPFLHFTGSTGTHIIFLELEEKYPAHGVRIPHLFGDADREKLLGEIKGLVRGMPGWNRGLLVLYYDGEAIRQITQKRAEAVAEEYDNRIKAAWRREAFERAKAERGGSWGAMA